jgi:single-stranded-DNA-specific exonuclease
MVVKMKSTWHILDADSEQVKKQADLLNLDRNLVSILHSRGYDTPEKIYRFLRPRLSDLHSPYLLDSMVDAVDRIRLAVEAGETIGIFSDSDLDGITSLAVLYNLFTRMDITPYYRYL